MKKVIVVLGVLIIVYACQAQQNSMFWQLNKFDASYEANDSDARKFIDTLKTVGCVLNDSIRIAIDSFVISLKQNYLWDKFVAIYPFIGSTSTSQKWNLKHPLDQDTCFRITFHGSPTHNSTGVQWDGSSQWADTHVIPSSIFTDNVHIDFLSHSNVDNLEVDWGVNDANSTYYWLFYNHYPNNTSFATRFPYLRVMTDLSNSNTSGFYTIDYDGNFTYAYLNGKLVGQVDEASDWRIPIGNSLTLGAWVVNNVVMIGSTKQFAYAAVGYGNFSDSEEIVYSSIVQNFMSRLHR